MAFNIPADLALNNIATLTINTLAIATFALMIHSVTPGILLEPVYTLVLIGLRCSGIIPISNLNFTSLNTSIFEGSLRNGSCRMQISKHI